jgi:hypothetical protein
MVMNANWDRYRAKYVYTYFKALFQLSFGGTGKARKASRQ